MKLYKIIRFYQDIRKTETIRINLTKKEAIEHCSDPETSSSTCSAEKNRAIGGIWFDGWTTMDGGDELAANYWD